ncbi:hypothetical protein F2Q70_00006623 [Brassica cretica]|uniref:NAB domain-containing protein n=1 Tax=Brassica cretica TaxID=69181 RepID=A0A8S9IM47_BRACR|nr:hypothetical protein F2Q70_00006623 [Brassica cretica]
MGNETNKTLQRIYRIASLGSPGRGDPKLFSFFYSSLNHRLVSPGFMDGHEFSDKQMSYRELMKKYLQCEEELRTASLQLQDAEQEIETKDADVETEKRQALELQRRVVDLESQLTDSTLKFENLVTFLEAKVKDFDSHKVRHDMLVAEKDGVCGEVDNLKAEIRSRDIDFKQMEEQLNQLVCRQTELVSESGNDKSTVEELRERVKELEKQAEIQRNALLEGEEEKREAIRQLCFSLDHYKTGYRQLLRFLSNNK